MGTCTSEGVGVRECEGYKTPKITVATLAPGFLNPARGEGCGQKKRVNNNIATTNNTHNDTHIQRFASVWMDGNRQEGGGSWRRRDTRDKHFSPTRGSKLFLTKHSHTHGTTSIYNTIQYINYSLAELGVVWNHIYLLPLPSVSTRSRECCCLRCARNVDLDSHWSLFCPIPFSCCW